jgi:hypothetical protein
MKEKCFLHSFTLTSSEVIFVVIAWQCCPNSWGETCVVSRKNAEKLIERGCGLIPQGLLLG